jgi:hypothetical protein
MSLLPNVNVYGGPIAPPRPSMRPVASLNLIACLLLVTGLPGCAALSQIGSPEPRTPAAVSAAPPATSMAAWSASTRGGRQALRERDFEGAERHFRAALDTSTSLRDSDVRVDVSFGNLVRVASIYERIGRREDARRVMTAVDAAASRRSGAPGRLLANRARFESLASRALPPRLAPPSETDSEESAPFDRLIVRTAHSYDVDPALVKAVVATESNFEPRAVSRVGAQGLMQLMPATALAMGVRRPFAPRENIRGGVRYLRKLLDRFDDLDHALAAYNAGPDAVTRYGGIPPYPETEAYVTKVLSRYRRYQNNFSR